MEIRVYVSDNTVLSSATDLVVKYHNTGFDIGSSKYGKKVDTNGKYYVYINGIAPRDFDVNYEISFGDAVRFRVSALGFARVNMNKVSATEKLLLQAMIRYYNNAEDYFAEPE